MKVTNESQHGGVVKQCVINVYGNQPAQFSTSLVQAILAAPNAEVGFGNNSHLDGSCFAQIKLISTPALLLRSEIQ